MKKFKSVFWWALIPIVIVTACKIKNESTLSVKFPSVNPALPQCQTPFESFEINADKGGEIKLPNGTLINIPAHSFKNADGSLVRGLVTIKYREFHKGADVIASGIPMLFKKEGKVEYFESAGMFEMRGTAGGKNIDIADDRAIEVQMASFKEGNDFEFYFFDDQQSEWQTKGKAEPIANMKKADAFSTYEQTIKPVVPAEVDKKAPVFDLTFDEIRNPELASFRNVLWQYAGTNEKNDPVNNSWVFQDSWDEYKMTCTDPEIPVFDLYVKSKNKSFTTSIKPVLTGENAKKGRKVFDKIMKDYNSALDGKKKAELQADLLRVFNVKQMGLYNWDRLMKMNASMLISADFTIEGEKFAAPVYLINGENNDVVTIYPGVSNTFYLNPKIKNVLVTILPSGLAAIFSAQQFEQINVSGVKATKKFKFNLNKLPARLESADDVSSLINSL
jgi:hypothetical protein